VEPEIQDVETAAAPEIQAELPGIRETKDVQMAFSEKKFAHLPARESQHKEAPYPKSKKLDTKPTD
jgi:hypothetical protein